MVASTRPLMTAALAAVFAALLTPAAATADHGGAANSGTPDNVDHYVDRNDIVSKTDDAVTHALVQLNRSVMNATLSGSEDVEVYDAYYGTSGEWNDVYGKTSCAGYTPFYLHCDVYLVRYNLSYFAGYMPGQVRSGGCHEFGHTAGLGHRTANNDTDDNSCMRSIVSGSRPIFDAHDIDAINSTF